ncbi:hypothetical protein [Halalkalibacter sp. APA_J-10(15)]|uniref:hypothetical protein n=1 Tax=Halalkalibacter sp. APA_J-10(15) TaxID=2933805 RepID=UPI001FF54DB3|nr:hypothetical protein [Halalkalibacter sp. APA_J-10(15)]
MEAKLLPVIDVKKELIEKFDCNDEVVNEFLKEYSVSYHLKNLVRHMGFFVYFSRIIELNSIKALSLYISIKKTVSIAIWSLDLQK